MYMGEEDWVDVDAGEYAYEKDRLEHGHDESVKCTPETCELVRAQKEVGW